MEEARPSRRIVAQRVRNRIIEYLELAASFEDQITYQRNAPNISVPNEVINQWEDWNSTDPREHWTSPEGVYTPEEVEAVQSFHTTWEHVADGTPDPLPELEATQRLAEWDELRRAARSALDVFAYRGPLPEDRELV